MNTCFSVDSTSPNSYSEVRDFLYIKLNDILKENRPIVFICIGTDRSTGDSLGPLVGYKLKFLSLNNIHVYGCLESPVHSKNLIDVLNKVNLQFNNPYIIAIDASLGSLHNIGKVFIEEGPLYPGLALNKDLPPVGDLSITGIVNISGNFEFMVLQNTRLYTVMALADCISNGIYHFILKSLGSNNKHFNNSLENIHYL
ncbi:spore protease YyaC [Clostridium gasigenes]|uniref:Spore protease YyaC n=1 Tax=Clostridium gasigenes TaxID=94869 RepID=A0A7X0SFU9_9CLOT|nr:spore protease YyaC [Clostridium gasigenes]MBB6716749.1 spore protease YyaC [Clostridium gasigenes]MBU3134472.1 spore protease YyaC [Clostridium gasigenes]MBU3138109.1 spore protease YyaC [Clostridium gasigenes]